MVVVVETEQLAALVVEQVVMELVVELVVL